MSDSLFLFLGHTCRVMNLQDPTKKMSKSDPSSRGRIDLTDTPSAIQSKIRKSVTDSISHISYEPETRPGVANLINIYSAISDITPDEIVQNYKDRTIFTKDLKADLSERLIKELEQFRSRYETLITEKNYLHDVLEAGSQKAREIAHVNIADVKSKLGLVI